MDLQLKLQYSGLEHVPQWQGRLSAPIPKMSPKHRSFGFKLYVSAILSRSDNGETHGNSMLIDDASVYVKQSHSNNINAYLWILGHYVLMVVLVAVVIVDLWC